MEPTQQSVKSAERVLDILEVLAQEPAGLGFTALLRTLQLPKSSLHQLLGVLVRRGYVSVHADTRTYTLGLRVWESGQAYMRQHDLVSEATITMTEIVGALNETAQLAVLDGLENVYLAKVDCTHPVRLQSAVGRRLPAHATGLGKTLLADLDPDELERRTHGQTLARFTPTTITSMAALHAELALIRERGFATDREEYTPGVRCVAVPIRDQHGHAMAAMSVTVPTLRVPPAPLHDALALLATGSLALARRLGNRVDDARLLRLQAPAFAQHMLQEDAAHGADAKPAAV